MTIGSQQGYNFILQAGFGQAPGNLVNYIEPVSVQAGEGLKTVVNIPFNTTNNQINLATLFPALTVINALIVRDITQIGQAVTISSANTGTKLPLKALGIMATTPMSAPFSLYVDNASLTAAATLEVTVIGS